MRARLESPISGWSSVANGVSTMRDRVHGAPVDPNGPPPTYILSPAPVPNFEMTSSAQFVGLISMKSGLYPAFWISVTAAITSSHWVDAPARADASDTLAYSTPAM